MDVIDGGNEYFVFSYASFVVYAILYCLLLTPGQQGRGVNVCVGACVCVYVYMFLLSLFFLIYFMCIYIYANVFHAY